MAAAHAGGDDDAMAAASPRRIIGGLLASVILLNAVGMSLPLTAVGILIVREVGFEGKPEALNMYEACAFVPVAANFFFGMLSDFVGVGSRAGRLPSARRALWIALGAAGSATTLLPFALGLVRTEAQLYLCGLPYSCMQAVTVASIEGMLVQRGREAAGSMSLSAPAARLRGAVQAADYQLRGLGALTGYGLSALALAFSSPAAAIMAGVGFYAAVVVLAAWLLYTAPSPTAPAAPAADGAPNALGVAAAPPPRPRLSALSTACACALLVFLYELPPTSDDTFSAYTYSGALGLSPSVLSAASTLKLAVAMVVAPICHGRLRLPPLASFAVGAAAEAMAELAHAALAPAVVGVAPPARRVLPLFFATSCFTAMCDGFAFLPVLTLAAIAAPAGSEATAFGLVTSAQSIASLGAAAISATLTARLGVGGGRSAAGSADTARSWARLPALVVVCAVLKLVALAFVLPLLRRVLRRGADGTLVLGGAAEREGTTPPPDDWRASFSAPLLDEGVGRVDVENDPVRAVAACPTGSGATD